MKSIAVTICCSLFLMPARSQNYYEYELAEASVSYRFDPGEIKDSGYRSLMIHRLYSDHIDNKNWRDTIYEAKFNSAGLVVFEKKKDFLLGTATNTHYYDDKYRRIMTIHEKQGGMWNTGKITVRKEFLGDTAVLAVYTIEKKGQPLTEEKYGVVYNEKGLIRYENRNNIRTDYIYNDNDRLIRRVTLYNDSSCLTEKYIYGKTETDSIVRTIAIEKEGRKVDSVFYVKKYNQQGLKIFESRKPSATYYKAFPAECTTGDTYTQRFSYDKKGNLLEEGVTFTDEWVSNGERFSIEIRGIYVTLKTWLSETSNLLYATDRMEAYSGNMKSFFTYKK